MKRCIILRGLPGSGKSTIAKELSCYLGYWSISADQYFTNPSGEYKFNPALLQFAHENCFERFKNCVDEQFYVIVDNTNTTKKEYQKYLDYAKSKGYSVTILTVETDLTDEELAKRNVHGVPVETIKRMRERMKSHG